jgi:transcriptional regulator with XRE-family HTH domain
MDFARRVQGELNRNGWTQAELARRMAPLLKDSRVGRDNISKYVRGKVLPLPHHLEAMAKALGVESRDLLPTRAPRATAEENPPFDMRAIDGDRAWLRVNQPVPWPIAIKIAALLKGVDLRPEPQQPTPRPTSKQERRHA